jgi:hypothetical protein
MRTIIKIFNVPRTRSYRIDTTDLIHAELLNIGIFREKKWIYNHVNAVFDNSYTFVGYTFDTNSSVSYSPTHVKVLFS